MPSQFSTSHSVDDAVQLSKNLGNPYDIIPIKNIYDSFLDTLNPFLKTYPLVLPKKISRAEPGETC